MNLELLINILTKHSLRVVDAYYFCGCNFDLMYY